jgi:RND family efflux transporter MFP subunit
MGKMSVLALAVISAFALAGCGDPKPQQKQGGAPPPALPVKVAQPLVKKIIEWDEFTGRFEPSSMVEVRARVSGYLDSRNFKDGQLVEKGQLLFVIDPRPYEAAADRAKAELARANTRQDLTASDLARAEKLLAARAISQEEYDSRRQARREADAQVTSAKAALRTSELDLEFTQIKSPVRGRISDRRVDLGNLVSGGSPQSTMLTTIMAVDPVYLSFDVSEADFLRYTRLRNQNGQSGAPRSEPLPVYAKLADEKEWTRRGRIDFIDNQLDSRSGTIRLRAVFDNPDGLLTPGVFARLRVPGSAEHDAILVPDEAIASDQARKIVMAVAEDGTVTPKPVTLGPIVEGLRVIRTGIGPQDRIVIDGIQRARPGGKVAPQVAKIEAKPDNG